MYLRRQFQVEAPLRARSSDTFLLAAGVSGRGAVNFAIEARQYRLDEGVFHDLHECLPGADVCLLQ